MRSAPEKGISVPRLRPTGLGPGSRLGPGTDGVGLLGSRATARVETFGRHQNPLIALVASSLPRVRAQAEQGNWSTSPFGPKTAEDLRQWRAAACGRNVILILLESTGAEYLASYGAGVDPTPRLTALAGQSILFENAYCVYPESIKGLFSVLCSQYPAFDTQPSDYERVRVPSLAQVLSTNGFRTALFRSGRFMYLGMESIIRQRGYTLLEDAGDIGGNQQSSFGVDEPATVTRMLAWIDARPGAPFFLTYLPIAGHHPYATPHGGPFPEKDELGRYYNALHEGDAALGAFLDGLQRRHLLKRRSSFCVAITAKRSVSTQATLATPSLLTKKMCTCPCFSSPRAWFRIKSGFDVWPV